VGPLRGRRCGHLSRRLCPLPARLPGALPSHPSIVCHVPAHIIRSFLPHPMIGSSPLLFLSWLVPYIPPAHLRAGGSTHHCRCAVGDPSGYRRLWALPGWPPPPRADGDFYVRTVCPPCADPLSCALRRCCSFRGRALSRHRLSACLSVPPPFHSLSLARARSLPLSFPERSFFSRGSSRSPVFRFPSRPKSSCMVFSIPFRWSVWLYMSLSLSSPQILLSSLCLSNARS
jgi:hypothetical protein